MNEILHEFTHVVTDPAHILAELVFQAVIDGLILGLGWRVLVKPWIDRRVAAEHKRIDVEHGYEHRDYRGTEYARKTRVD